MKTFITTLAGAAIAACTALPAMAAPVCIVSRLIDHTSVQDSKTVLFHMKDGKVWRNTLQNPCPSLNFHGFVMNMGPVDTVCSNQQSIRVLKTNETCMLGEFVPNTPPAAAAGQKS
jgi:hypothetical protein